MPLILLVLLIGVLGYLYWQRRTTTLTRACRWRQSRRTGGWSCAYCGAVSSAPEEPTHCARPSDGPPDL